VSMTGRHAQHSCYMDIFFAGERTFCVSTRSTTFISHFVKHIFGSYRRPLRFILLFSYRDAWRAFYANLLHLRYIRLR